MYVPMTFKCVDYISHIELRMVLHNSDMLYGAISAWEHIIVWCGRRLLFGWVSYGHHSKAVSLKISYHTVPSCGFSFCFIGRSFYSRISYFCSLNGSALPGELDTSPSLIIALSLFSTVSQYPCDNSCNCSHGEIIPYFILPLSGSYILPAHRCGMRVFQL